MGFCRGSQRPRPPRPPAAMIRRGLLQQVHGVPSPFPRAPAKRAETQMNADERGCRVPANRCMGFFPLPVMARPNGLPRAPPGSMGQSTPTPARHRSSPDPSCTHRPHGSWGSVAVCANRAFAPLPGVLAPPQARVSHGGHEGSTEGHEVSRGYPRSRGVASGDSSAPRGAP